jgi:hypothetical protein
MSQCNNLLIVMYFFTISCAGIANLSDIGSERKYLFVIHKKRASSLKDINSKLILDYFVLGIPQSDIQSFKKEFLDSGNTLVDRLNVFTTFSNSEDSIINLYGYGENCRFNSKIGNFIKEFVQIEDLEVVSIADKSKNEVFDFYEITDTSCFREIQSKEMLNTMNYNRGYLDWVEDYYNYSGKNTTTYFERLKIINYKPELKSVFISPAIKLKFLFPFYP